MSRFMVLVLIAFWAVTADAAETAVRLDPLPGCTIVWDYEPNPALAYFALYKRAPDQSFSNTPTKIISSMQALVLGIPCSSVPWGAHGLYYIALKAFPITGDPGPSEFSNEVLAQWGDAVAEVPPPTRPTDPTKPPKTYLPPTPPPLIGGPKPPTPPPSGQGLWFTETCGYTGRCPAP